MKFIISSFLVSLSMSGISMAASHPHAYGGVPSDGAFLERQGYIVQFDAERKTPNWVAYHVKPSYLETPKREGPYGKFRDDPDLSNEATEKDYKGQFNTWRNYAKGHLAPYFISGGCGGPQNPNNVLSSDSLT